MTLTIQRLDGTRYDLKALGIRVIDFSPESLNIQNTVEQMDGGNYVVTKTEYGVRYCHAELEVRGADISDLALRRAEVFDLFGSVEPFYVIDAREGGQRWLVKNDGNFSIARKFAKGTFTARWLCVNKFAESIGTSLELMERSFDGDSNGNGLWGFGSRIDVEKAYNYVFTSNTFELDNIGTAPVDPRESQLEITIKAVAAEYIEIENQTTGDVYRFNGALTASDTLILRGIQSYKNSVSVYGDTNQQLIKLAPGVNRFRVTGATIEQIQFNFRFLFK